MNIFTKNVYQITYIQKILLYIYTKNVLTVQTLYTVQTKNGLKREIYAFCHKENLQTIQNLYK